MTGNGKQGAAGAVQAGEWSFYDEHYVRRCDFEGLVAPETLTLTSIGQILDEYGTGLPEPGEECGHDAEVSVKALVMWSLGRTLRQSVDELTRKLVIAQRRLKDLGVREVLEEATPSAAPERHISGRAGRARSGAAS